MPVAAGSMKMAMKATFVDAGVLIAAARGTQDVSTAALSLLTDPEREFVASPFLRLEVLPKAIYHHRTLEIAFYERYFQGVKHWADSSDGLVDDAYCEACAAGLSALDALHVVAAIRGGAVDLVTTEKRTTLANRVRGISVVTLRVDHGSAAPP